MALCLGGTRCCFLWTVQRLLLFRCQGRLLDDLVVFRLIFVQGKHPIKLNLYRHSILLRKHPLDCLVATALLDEMIAAVLQADGQAAVLQSLTTAFKNPVGRVSALSKLVHDIFHRLTAEQLRTVAGLDFKQCQIRHLHDLALHPKDFLSGDSGFRAKLHLNFPLFSFGIDMMNGGFHQFPCDISLQKGAKDIRKTVHRLFPPLFSA